MHREAKRGLDDVFPSLPPSIFAGGRVEPLKVPFPDGLVLDKDTGREGAFGVAVELGGELDPGLDVGEAGGAVDLGGGKEGGRER